VLINGTISAGMITNTGMIGGSGALASAVNNSGMISATNGTLSIGGTATGAGLYRAESGATLSFGGGGSLSSLYGTGATLQVTGGILTNSTAGFDNTGGTLAFAGGSYYHASGGLFTNASTGWVVGYGSLNAAGSILNQGTILANGGRSRPLILNSNLLNTASSYVTAIGGALQVNGVFTNNGTLQVISGVGTYNLVVNNNYWQTAGASSTFEDTFLITTNGYVSAANGDQYVFKANLLNQSQSNLFWSTLALSPGTNTVGGVQFLFSGSGVTHTQLFEHPGLLLTGGFGAATTNATDPQAVNGSAAGFANNFAVDELVLTNTTLVLAPAGSANALFVNDLFLYGTAHLTISNNMDVYFVNSNDWSLADITLLGNAQIHQLTGLGTSLIIPEPNVLLMWLCGGVTLWAARRHNRRTRRHRRHRHH